MKLFGRKQWLISTIALILGLIFSAYILEIKYGDINYWIVSITGLIGLVILIIVGRYANKQ